MGISEASVFVSEKVPYVIKDVKAPLFTTPVSEPLNEVSLLIKEELLAEDEKKKKKKTTKVPKGTAVTEENS